MTITARILQSFGLHINKSAIASRELGITADTEQPVIGTTVGGAKYLGTEDYVTIATAAPAAIAIIRRSFVEYLCDTVGSGANIALDIRAGAETLGARLKVYALGATAYKVVVQYATGVFSDVPAGSSTEFVWNGSAWSPSKAALAISSASCTGNSATATSAAACTGNAATATLAADATKLKTARTIGGEPFDGSANINLPGVNTSGNQNTSGNAASATLVHTDTTIENASYQIALVEPGSGQRAVKQSLSLGSYNPFLNSASINITGNAGTVNRGVYGYTQTETAPAGAYIKFNLLTNTFVFALEASPQTVPANVFWLKIG